MSAHLDRTWTVLDSHQTFDATRCVDIFSRPNGTFGFEEFRRDPEDGGAWTPLRSFLNLEYPSVALALEGARKNVAWLGPLLDDAAS